MTPKRLLLVANDRLLAHCYTDRLDAAGFAVGGTYDGESALMLVQDSQPDVVVVDPLLPTMDGLDLIRTLRKQEATKHIPLIVLPSFQPQIENAARLAGATKVVERAPNMPAGMIDAVETALDMRRTHVHFLSAPLEPDPAWVQTAFANAPATVAEMHQELHEVMRDHSDRRALRTLLQQSHNLAEQMSMLQQRALGHATAAIEVLVADLLKMPDQINASTLRTLGQAIDFLNVLLEEQNRDRVGDPARSSVLIVDDETAARDIISVAMEMVRLKPVLAESPDRCLAVLEKQLVDLIFLDIGMPGMSGFDLCTKIRAIPMHERTPIVFLTGMATFQNRVQSSLSGGNDFIGKPFNLPELGLKALVWVYKGQLGLV